MQFLPFRNETRLRKNLPKDVIDRTALDQEKINRES